MQKLIINDKCGDWSIKTYLVKDKSGYYYKITRAFEGMPETTHAIVPIKTKKQIKHKM